ncbi:MAG: hypothetical protein H7Z13_13395 [Ferruginibacter sp.]|nr:hypothetical protein [Ferruginibacter sp.]
MERLRKQMENKFCVLLSFLTQLPGKLEMIADEIDNENLRNALCAVAIESNQYALELNAHLRSLEIIPPVFAGNNLEEEIIENGLVDLPKEKGKEVLSICEKTEAFFCELYTDLLNECASDTSLKDMMHYQLLGIRSAFMRIRFLNSLRFHN